MQLRKCCNHPYLFPGAEPDFDGTTSEALINGRGLHSSTSQLNLSRFSLEITLNTPLHPLTPPTHTLSTL
jgi:hypothetical protein